MVRIPPKNLNPPLEVDSHQVEQVSTAKSLPLDVAEPTVDRIPRDATNVSLVIQEPHDHIHSAQISERTVSFSEEIARHVSVYLSQPQLLLNVSGMQLDQIRNYIAQTNDQSLIHAISKQENSHQIITHMLQGLNEQEKSEFSAVLIGNCLDNWTDGTEGWLLRLLIAIVETIAKLFTLQLGENFSDQRSINAVFEALPENVVCDVLVRLQSEHKLGKLYHDVRSPEAERRLWQVTLEKIDDPQLQVAVIQAGLAGGLSIADKKCLMAFFKEQPMQNRIFLLTELGIRSSHVGLFGVTVNKQVCELLFDTFGNGDPVQNFSECARAYMDQEFDASRRDMLEQNAFQEETQEVSFLLNTYGSMNNWPAKAWKEYLDALGRKSYERNVEATWNIALQCEGAYTKRSDHWTVDQMQWLHQSLQRFPVEHIRENGHLRFISKARHPQGELLGLEEGQAVRPGLDWRGATQRENGFEQGVVMFTSNFSKHNRKDWVLAHEIGHTIIMSEPGSANDFLTDFSFGEWERVAGWSQESPGQIDIPEELKGTFYSRGGVIGDRIYIPAWDIGGLYFLSHTLIRDARGQIDYEASGFPTVYSRSNPYEQFAELYREYVDDPFAELERLTPHEAHDSVRNILVSQRFKRRDMQYRIIGAHLAQTQEQRQLLQQLLMTFQQRFLACNNAIDMNDVIADYDQQFIDLVAPGEDISILTESNAFRIHDEWHMQTISMAEITWLPRSVVNAYQQSYQQQCEQLQHEYYQSLGSIDLTARIEGLSSQVSQQVIQTGVQQYLLAVIMMQYDSLIPDDMASQAMILIRNMEINGQQEITFDDSNQQFTDLHAELQNLFSGTSFVHYLQTIQATYEFCKQAIMPYVTPCTSYEISKMETELLQELQDQLARSCDTEIGLEHYEQVRGDIIMSFINSYES